MWKNRLGYGLFLTILAVLIFFFGKSFLFCVFVIFVAWMVMDSLLLRYEANHIQVRFRLHSGIKEGEQLKGILSIESTGIMFAAQWLLLDMEIHNKMFDVSECHHLEVEISNRQKEIPFVVPAEWCGETEINCTSVCIRDVLQLSEKKIRSFALINAVVFPRNVNVQVEMSTSTIGAPLDEGMMQNRKGNDPSEIFDIKDYTPGDDLRFVHWKLSGKADHLIMRQPSEPTHYHAIILMDLGMEQDGQSVTRTELNGAAAVGAALCQEIYTYEPKKPPQGEDPILWFLTQSHEGNDVLYASAAVEALRTHGVPARYAEGYYVSDTDFQKSEDGSVAVTGFNAHAWVEIYFDGIGWLPVEVTPGYYYDTVTLRKLISTSNVIRKTAAVEDNPNRADPLLTAGGQGGGQSSKAVEVVKDVEAIVLGIVVIFILLVIFLIIALELHRIVIIRRKGKYLKNASQEERVIEIEKRIFLMMNFRGIEARLGWKTEKTDQCLAERFEWAQPGDYARVCSILEKAVYGGCELEAYEMRTLYYFLEKISAADTTDDWKIRIKMRYAC